MESVNLSRRIEIHLWSLLIQTLGISRLLGRYSDRERLSFLHFSQIRSILEYLEFAFMGLVLGFSIGYLVFFMLTK
jgi:hypothetical protein